MNEILDAIESRLVLPSADGGERDHGCYRKTIVTADAVMQLYFVERGTRFGKFVSRRTVTCGGISRDENFDPPIHETELPAPFKPAPQDGTGNAVGGKGPKVSRRPPTANNSKAAAVT